MSLRYSHVGLCVADLERATTFWCDGLGFSPVARFELGDEVAAGLEVEPPLHVVSQLIALDEHAVELLCFGGGASGAPSTRRDHLGLTHVCLRADDVDPLARAEQLVPYGGTVLHDTHTVLPHGGGVSTELVFVADPDGNRVELLATVTRGDAG